MLAPSVCQSWRAVARPEGRGTGQRRNIMRHVMRATCHGGNEAFNQDNARVEWLVGALLPSSAIVPLDLRTPVS